MKNVHVVPDVGTPPRGEIAWYWISGDDGGLALFPNQSSLRRIESIQPRLVGSYRLGDAIAAFGEPTHVLADAFCYPDNSGAEYSLSVIFAASGLALRTSSTYMPTTASTLVDSNTTFTGAMFFTLQEPLSTIWPPGPAGANALVPWQGPGPLGQYLHDHTGGNFCKPKATP